MNYSNYDDGGDQSREEHEVSPNAAWPIESVVNDNRQPYGTQPVSEPIGYTPAGSDGPWVGSSSNFPTYHVGGRNQASAAAAYQNSGGGGEWQGSQTTPAQYTTSHGLGRSRNPPYNHQSGNSYHEYGYSRTAGGHGGVSSYTAPSVPLEAQIGEPWNDYGPSETGMPRSCPASASIGAQQSPLQVQQNSSEYSVQCPYRCGTVLHGVHALGNLTRHLKSETCSGSGKAKVKYPCPIQGCDKEYARSDGMRVHLRKQHGAPPPPSKDPEDEE